SELPHFGRRGDMVGDYSAGCYFASLPSRENREFLKQFSKRFGPGERVNDVMQTAYAGVYLWKAAVERAQSYDTDLVRKALPKLSVDAPGGPLRVAANLHAYRTAYVGQITQGSQFRIVYSSPEPLPPEPFPAWQSEEQWQKLLDGLYLKWGKK